MNRNVAPTTGVEVRKEPTQARSRRRVDQIFAAVEAILERDGFDALTTSTIAKEAGIPVASVYQFFANKEEILACLFADWLSRVHQVIDRVEEAHYLEVDWRTFFDRLFAEVGADATIRPGLTGVSAWAIEAELMRAVRSNQRLSEMEDQHRNEIAHRFAGFLQGYGSKWPNEKLIRLAFLVYDIHDAVIGQQEGHQSSQAITQAKGWRALVFNALFEECLGDA